MAIRLVSTNQMEIIAIICGLLSLACFVSAVGGFYVPGLRKSRGIFCFLMVFGGVIVAMPSWFSIKLLQANQALPSRELIYAKMKEAAEEGDRSAVFSKLKAMGFRPEMYEEPYDRALPKGVKSLRFSPEQIKKATSYIWARGGRVRVRYLGLIPPYASLEAEFLFDSEGKIIAWESWIKSPV